MTNEYKHMIDRLAKARNFDGGSYILMTLLQDESRCQLDIKCKTHKLIDAASMFVQEAFRQAEQENDKTAQSALCEWLNKIVLQNQIQRFEEVINK